MVGWKGRGRIEEATSIEPGARRREESGILREGLESEEEETGAESASTSLLLK